MKNYFFLKFFSLIALMFININVYAACTPYPIGYPNYRINTSDQAYQQCSGNFFPPNGFCSSPTSPIPGWWQSIGYSCDTPVSVCPNGAFNNPDGSCPVVPCPTGQTRDSSGVCVTPPPVCTTGQILSNGACIPDPALNNSGSGSGSGTPSGSGTGTVSGSGSPSHLPPSLSTAFTSLVSDVLALINSAWTYALAVVIGFIILRLFKKAASNAV